MTTGCCSVGQLALLDVGCGQGIGIVPTTQLHRFTWLEFGHWRGTHEIGQARIADAQIGQRHGARIAQCVFETHEIADLACPAIVGAILQRGRHVERELDALHLDVDNILSLYRATLTRRFGIGPGGIAHNASSDFSAGNGVLVAGTTQLGAGAGSQFRYRLALQTRQQRVADAYIAQHEVARVGDPVAVSNDVSRIAGHAAAIAVGDTAFHLQRECRHGRGCNLRRHANLGACLDRGAGIAPGTAGGRVIVYEAGGLVACAEDQTGAGTGKFCRGASSETGHGSAAQARQLAVAHRDVA